MYRGVKYPLYYIFMQGDDDIFSGEWRETDDIRLIQWYNIDRNERKFDKIAQDAYFTNCSPENAANRFKEIQELNPSDQDIAKNFQNKKKTTSKEGSNQFSYGSKYNFPHILTKEESYEIFRKIPSLTDRTICFNHGDANIPHHFPNMDSLTNHFLFSFGTVKEKIINSDVRKIINDSRVFIPLFDDFVIRLFASDINKLISVADQLDRQTLETEKNNLESRFRLFMDKFNNSSYISQLLEKVLLVVSHIYWTSESMNSQYLKSRLYYIIAIKLREAAPNIQNYIRTQQQERIIKMMQQVQGIFSHTHSDSFPNDVKNIINEIYATLMNILRAPQ